MTGKVKIITAGAGGALYSTRGTQIGTSFVLIVDGIQIVLDMGQGTFTNSGRIPGLELAQTDIVVLSHFHLDHFGGALEWIHGIQKLSEKKRGAAQELIVYGPAGFGKFVMEGIKLANKKFVPNLVFNEGPGDYGLIKMFPVRHSPEESLATLIRGSTEIIYTGDINPDPFNIEAVCGATENPGILITEATERKSSWHIDGQKARELKEKGGFEYEILSHTRPSHLRTVKRICAKSEGRIFRAVTGKTITIR